ncbi:MAG: ABC transporter ATP-binding protein [Candidatus Thermoplasmatota archaeon]|jgi:ABC-2 type transport system ATP-binding protein|nr:ABC transporter ATP-binding protein [Candidatus Thermoplasmatota archaeon]MCL5732602.1 ABC transporter ATP-binding protein [Candidatus Thermoplasmatota archaeon]
MNPPSIVIHNLVKNYGETRALDGVDMEISPGEIFGLLGPNGSGKTTLLRIICSILDYTSGYVRVSGLDVSRDSLEVKRITGYVPETPVLYESLTPTEFLNFIGSVRKIDHETLARRIESFASALEIMDKMNTFIGSLSFGTKQKVAIMAALIHDPEIIILDEGMNGLDPRSAKILKNLLNDYAARGRTIIFSTHVLEVAETVCTRMSIIYRGKIVDTGTLEEMRERSGTSKLEDIFLNITGEGDLGPVIKSLRETMSS